jgi:L-serine dehydratase
LWAYDRGGRELAQRTYYSVGGGFVRKAAADGTLGVEADDSELPYPFESGAQLLDRTRRTRLTIADLMRANERAWHSGREIQDRLLGIWSEMQACVARGLASTEATLPGGLRVPRRAPAVHRQLVSEPQDEHLRAMDWIGLYALAVNEENAAGGRVVTAPTNGAAGIIPAVLHCYNAYCPEANEDRIADFLLTAGAIGIIFKQSASISGAEVGCQGEVGSACAMAAAGLAAVLGGTPEQVENAAEIGLEHNLGLTCDPVGGLVQIPCIERNAVAAVKAVAAARTALRGDGVHIVSLDKALKTMMETGRDMSVKYKETARGGLAVNVIEC